MKDRYEIDSDDMGEWYVYDEEDCFCCAGPMTEEEAINMKIKLNNERG